MRSTPFLFFCLLVTLTACNAVHSDKPLFTPADAQGAPPLRPGLWLQKDVLTETFYSDCRVKAAKPVRKWPSCAEWVLVRETDMAAYDPKDDGGAWTSLTYVLAGGRTRILQMTTSGRKRDGETRSPDEDDQQGSYYAGVTPTAYDAEGRITAYKSWDAKCGPRDQTQYPPDSGVHPTTLEPLPGLTMEADGQSCTTQDQEAVRGSVEASREWDTELQEAQWVRDPRPDDFAQPK